ncbi:MAG: type II toxin-antitoxin system VapC family toxin [Sulfurovum sp.]
MIYFDTNIYLYAFLSNVDDVNQQNQSVDVLKDALNNNALLTSEIKLYEYAFVSKKHHEEQDEIKKYLDFLTKFIKPSKSVYSRALEIMDTKDFYRHSFDVFHLAFSEYYKCHKLITFDKGFKKLQDITDVEIIIL